MKKIAVILLIFLMSIIACRKVAKKVITKLQDWEFIQSVGGMKLGTPLKTQDGWYLPVICDVSGTVKITVKPTKANSALKCLKLHADREEDKIYITISTGVGESDYDTSRCSAVNIGYMNDGEYQVHYQDDKKHSPFVGKISIKN